MFKTSFCTGRLCYRDVILVCFATGVKLLAHEDKASTVEEVLRGEPPSTMRFRSFLKMTLEMRAEAMAKPLTALHLFRLFSK